MVQEVKANKGQMGIYEGRSLCKGKSQLSEELAYGLERVFASYTPDKNLSLELHKELKINEIIREQSNF